jgi:glutathione S-transferase
MSTRPYTLYGWHLSYFTGKVLCYLRYKGIPFVDQPVSMYTLMVTIKRETGEVVMPVLRTPENTWLQDSSVIIDTLEEQFPSRPVVPATPVQRFVSYLFEAWGDEWWIPIAMHTRWSYPENYALFEHDAGNALLPGFPAVFKRAAVRKIAGTLRSYLHGVGVRKDQFALMNAWTDAMLDQLDAHFAAHDYLQGGRPTLGDFGLVGTMYGHLGRDPWPARELVATRPHLRAWINRMAAPDQSSQHFGDLLPEDTIADTLLPVIRQIFAEFTPMITGIASEVAKLSPRPAPGRALPRRLGEISIPTHAGVFRRNALPYTLWMAQRTLDAVRAMPVAQQDQVAAFAAANNGGEFLHLELPRLRRVGLRVAFES